jgi:hypothetical protein
MAVGLDELARWIAKAAVAANAQLRLVRPGCYTRYNRYTSSVLHLICVLFRVISLSGLFLRSCNTATILIFQQLITKLTRNMMYAV